MLTSGPFHATGGAISPRLVPAVPGPLVGARRQEFVHQAPLEIGLVDELAETPADVLPAALAWCELHLALPRHALALSRAMVRADLHAIFEKYSASENDAWVELWFSEATQATLQKLVASLGK